MADKDKLNGLIKVIKTILKNEKDNWFLDKLLSELKEASHDLNLSENNTLNQIQEYCIEDNIKKLASEFYKDFRIVAIKDQLITDFIKMEHERRRNDFENFSLCVYQQIENIVNFLFDNYVEKIWEENKNRNAISRWDKNSQKYVISDYVKKVNELIFGQYDKWYASSKTKGVLYFLYYNEILTNTNIFIQKSIDIDEIYQIRNKNHRGEKLNNEYVENILINIKGKESIYYLKFYGVLADFINGINNSLIEKGF